MQSWILVMLVVVPDYVLGYFLKPLVFFIQKSLAAAYRKYCMNLMCLFVLLYIFEYVSEYVAASVCFCWMEVLKHVSVFCFIASNWATGEDDHVVARAEYDFTAASEEEISLQAGEMLNLAPKGKRTRKKSEHKGT